MTLKSAPFLLSIAALLAAVPATAETAPLPQEASIPFVNMGSVRDWRADGTHGLYVRISAANGIMRR
jgi:hypothetical protein